MSSLKSSSSEAQLNVEADAQATSVPTMKSMIDGNRHDDRFRFFTMSMIDTVPNSLIDMEQRITEMLNDGWTMFRSEKMGNNEHTITLGFWFVR